MTAEDLPLPTSCEVWEVGKYPESSVEQGIPSDLVRNIALGKGLPAEFYTTGKVPPDFCKPVKGVWTFNDHGPHFYDTDPAVLLRQNVSGRNRAVIENILKRTPRADRIYVKWMYYQPSGELIVFSMKPTYTGLYMTGGPPYKVLNNPNLIVIANGGEVGPPPP